MAYLLIQVVICVLFVRFIEIIMSCWSLNRRPLTFFVPTFNLDLNRKLKEKLDKEIPVITVVAITGTTEQSAVDPVNAIVHLRGKFRTKVRITLTLYDFIMIVPIFVVSWIIFDIINREFKQNSMAGSTIANNFANGRRSSAVVTAHPSSSKAVICYIYI